MGECRLCFGDQVVPAEGAFWRSVSIVLFFLPISWSWHFSESPGDLGERFYISVFYDEYTRDDQPRFGHSFGRPQHPRQDTIASLLESVQ